MPADPPSDPASSHQEPTSDRARSTGPKLAEPADLDLLRDPNVEAVVGVTAHDLGYVMLLESVKGFGPQKFREVYDAGLTAEEVVTDPVRLPIKGKRGDEFRTALRAFTAEDVERYRTIAVRQIAQAHRHQSKAVLLGRTGYPENVAESNNPIPVLWVRGDLGILARRRAVACVGSRKIAGLYEQRHREFAQHAVSRNMVIVSGFALGADTVGHVAARDARGATLCVMPCGLDRPFPPENKALWKEFCDYPGAVMVSEFPFGTGAASLTLRKRNKLIVAFARGVLISQSAMDGGAMNAYRFALEQKKPTATFGDDDSDATSGNVKIGSDEPKGTVFRLDPPDREAWDTWLDVLCSGI